jgi:hypothetical protein
MAHLNIIPTHGVPVTVRCITLKQCVHFRLYPKWTSNGKIAFLWHVKDVWLSIYVPIY